MQRVVIIQGALTHYRVKFFECLRENLAQAGIELELFHGKPPKNPDYVTGTLEWAHPVALFRLGLFCWHSNTWMQAQKADLVIAPQELRNGVPLMIQITRRLTRTRFAYWGHGKGFQSRNPNGFMETLKRFLRNHTDWWFAYNRISWNLVVEGGFPAGRTTAVMNSIDTAKLRSFRDALSDTSLSDFRMMVNITSDNVAIFAGGMVPNKRIPFLLEALMEIRRQIPDFEMIFIGGGTERHFVSEAAAKHSWIHDCGPMNMAETVPYWAISKLMLMPGLVGLVILDTFALGVPIVTSDFPYHSPEIDYLEDGINGLVIRCGESSAAYAEGVTGLLKDPKRIEELKNQALSSAGIYSVEKMAKNFTHGVIEALQS